MAASSSLKNLHESISQNWFKQSTSRINSAQSDKSQRSNRTRKSSGKNSKYYPDPISENGQLLPGHLKVKTKKAETHQSSATGVEIKQTENPKYSKQRPKVTVKEVFEKVHANLRESKASGRMSHTNYPSSNPGSSLDNLYGTFDSTDQYLLYTTGKNKYKYRSLSSELENKRSAKVPDEEVTKLSAVNAVVQDNFMLKDSPKNTKEDIIGVQESSCEKTLGECSYISEPSSMTISRGNKVSST